MESALSDGWNSPSTEATRVFLGAVVPHPRILYFFPVVPGRTTTRMVTGFLLTSEVALVTSQVPSHAFHSSVATPEASVLNAFL